MALKRYKIHFSVEGSQPLTFLHDNARSRISCKCYTENDQKVGIGSSSERGAFAKLIRLALI